MDNYKLILYILTILQFSLFGVLRRDDLPDIKYIKLADGKAFSPVGIVEGGGGIGTGFLIAKNIVITAAHVVYKREKAKFSIFSSYTYGWKSYEGDIHIHEKFTQEKDEDGNTTHLNNDIALIILKEEIKQIEPASLSDERDLIHKEIIGCGFGQNGTGITGGKSIDRKKRAFTNIIEEIGEWSNEEYYICFFRSPCDATCITSMEGCGASGDSGSPVFIDTVGGKKVIGFIVGLSNKGKYGAINLIVPINRYKQWILDKSQNMIK